MSSSSLSKDKFFENVINPYLPEVMKHPQTMKLREGVLHIRGVQGPKKEGSEKARLEAVDHEIFKCQGMVESGLSVNHSMFTNFVHENKRDNKDIGGAIFKLHDRIGHLQSQIYDLYNQNSEYEPRLTRMSLDADFRIRETPSSFFEGEHMPWKTEYKPTISSPTSPKKDT